MLINTFKKIVASEQNSTLMQSQGRSFLAQDGLDAVSGPVRPAAQARA
jgi:hypothetical protein